MRRFDRMPLITEIPAILPNTSFKVIIFTDRNSFDSFVFEAQSDKMMTNYMSLFGKFFRTFGR
jgi:hypothetical protein